MTIQDVRYLTRKSISDERGYLTEILRNDDDYIFQNFGQVYLTTVYPNVVKAWHLHKIQEDVIFCVKGTLKLVLYDNRPESKTFGEIQEFFIGERNPTIVTVPTNVYHGFQAVGNEIAYVICIPTRAYDYEKPDEYRIPPNSSLIPYEWELVPGLKHG